MRIFISFEDVRLPMDVLPGQTVESVKIVLKDHFKLNSSHAEGKVLQLQYAGAVLRDEWVCSDIGITSGSTIKSSLIDSDQPVLHIKCVFSGETIVIREQLNFATTYVSHLTQTASSRSGLPVSVFRLCTNEGNEMYNCHILERYGVNFGSTIKLHVWDGWTDLLKAACKGHTRQVMKCASSDDQVAKFQLRVACFIAAHFDYVDLANSMLNPKAGAVKPEEAVGQHPARLWSMASAHVDIWKSPVHEAVECGKVNVLRIFVQNNLSCLIAKDGSGRTPMQVAFRHRQLECVQYLSSKLFSSHTENAVTLPVLIVIKTRKWSERARDQVLASIGSFKSSMRRRPYRVAAVVGQGVIVDGFSDNTMNSRTRNFEVPVSDETPPNIQGLTNGSKNNIRKIKPNFDRTESQENTKQMELEHFESRGLANATPKLPSLSRLANNSTHETSKAISPGDQQELSRDKGSYIQTPNQGQSGLPEIAKGSGPKARQRKRLIGGGIPLPAISVENHLRPFFYTSSKMENAVLVTLNVFEKYRQMTSRDNAIQCMTLASTFKDKAWLRQVDLAISLARRGVSNSVFEDFETKTSLPRVAASPIKIKE